jgi:hypothetical protein
MDARCSKWNEVAAGAIVRNLKCIVDCTEKALVVAEGQVFYVTSRRG